MPGRLVALVSSDDATAVVRVHADRLHDFLRRLGCRAKVAAELTEGTAVDLLDALVTRPAEVGDMAGWWFRRAAQVAERVVAQTGRVRAPQGRSGLLGPADTATTAALNRLAGPTRRALLLRDAYDLAPQSVGVALGRDADAAARLVAGARRALLGTAGRPATGPPVGPGHAELVTLGRLADGSLPAGAAPALRRHVDSCAPCRDALSVQTRARAALAALPVLALPDDALDRLVRRVQQRAEAALPSVEEVVLTTERSAERPRVLPAVVAVATLLAALLLGLLVAVLTRVPASPHPARSISATRNANSSD